ncbi:hypothetical protein C6P40_005056, partial [Pichia californica]
LNDGLEDRIDDQVDDDIYGETYQDEENISLKTPSSKILQTSKTDKKLEELSKLLNGVDLESDDDDWVGSSNKSKTKARKGKSKSKSSNTSDSTKRTGSSENINIERCSVCSESFTSRNKLFQHVNVTGHAAPPSK